ncbi:MAG: FMN-binding glutamate synthase family protein [Saprospiraceae bacterium]|nr:FMN-binding glutamate synthase family protein [Saprospiraceae bacterium]
MRNEFVAFAILSVLLVVGIAYYVWPPMWWTFVLLGPLLLLGLYDMFQARHAVMRNFPILGRGRYIMEDLRPKMYQYFIESDTSGRPINRISRSIVYQRAKQVLDTTPYGTQLDVYEEGYEWINHSIGSKHIEPGQAQPRVRIGGAECTKPYSASVLNVSAMSFGSLSKNAILALNGGAKIGQFAHNTGEGGLSPYHLQHGGDIIYQFGTGYFGCRDMAGNFSPDLFAKCVEDEHVKMVELKLSQGAKPGHGGILPAKKNTREIARIRGVVPGTDVLSPPSHTAFTSPLELVEFIQSLRGLSFGKPIGFKLCIGWRSEFLAICKAMVKLDIYPDFIAVDGGEGGTGAAPLEFTNSVGMPYRDAVAFVHNALFGFGIRDKIKIIASGKIISGFDIVKSLALGADLCYSARAMMLALGCIQALECNKNNCPTGVATQDPELVAGLSVSDKKVRVANYHRQTVRSLMELISASGLESPDQVSRYLIHRRISPLEVRTYAEIYPYISRGSLLYEGSIPPHFDRDMAMASPESFLPRFVEVN